MTGSNTFPPDPKPEQRALSLDFHESLIHNLKTSGHDFSPWYFSQSLQFSGNKGEANTEEACLPSISNQSARVTRLFTHKSTKTKGESVLYLIK